MNERLLALQKQAYAYADKHTQEGDNQFAMIQLGKFAELIVRECVKLQYKNVVVGGVSDYNRGRRELAEEISKHFGVEE